MKKYDKTAMAAAVNAWEKSFNDVSWDSFVAKIQLKADEEVKNFDAQSFDVCFGETVKAISFLYFIGSVSKEDLDLWKEKAWEFYNSNNPENHKKLAFIHNAFCEVERIAKAA